MQDYKVTCDAATLETELSKCHEDYESACSDVGVDLITQPVSQHFFNVIPI